MPSARFDVEADSIRIGLPITAPTSKIRVKRRRENEMARTVATRKEPMSDSDYLEWQIAYSELNRIVETARARGWLDDSQWRGALDGIRADFDGIAETESVVRVESQTVASAETKTVARAGAKISQFGFMRAEYRFPCYIKRGDDYEIEITFFRRQRAVGLQAMIYVNLPLRRCRAENGEPLIGRCATKKEIALFRVCRENARLAIDLIEAFACASRTHRADLRREIKCL